MTTQSQEVRSHWQEKLLSQKCLLLLIRARPELRLHIPRAELCAPEVLDKLHREIIHLTTGYIQIRPHLNPDWKIGFVGEPGDCKTVSAVKIVLYDFMFHGRPCYSNMKIKYTLTIPDDDPWCRFLGIPGGDVTFESLPLDKTALFKMDNRYRGAVLFADEINLELGEARRSSSNVNLNLNKVGQELRHLGAALIYTVISEMWVDARIRQLTDIFIRTQDTALDIENLERQAIPGMKARWQCYYMSRKINGTSYFDNHEKYGPYYIHVRNMWDAYDTLELQASANLKYGDYLKAASAKNVIQVEPQDDNTNDEWAWLNPIAESLLNSPDMVVPAIEIYNHPEVVRRGISKNSITEILKENFGIKTRRYVKDGDRQTYYIIPEEARFQLV